MAVALANEGRSPLTIRSSLVRAQEGNEKLFARLKKTYTRGGPESLAPGAFETRESHRVRQAMKAQPHHSKQEKVAPSHSDHGARGGSMRVRESVHRGQSDGARPCAARRAALDKTNCRDSEQPLKSRRSRRFTRSRVMWLSQHAKKRGAET
ncbi:hypothetical protein FGB62_3g351 [Gracilaria domingensis]|nr:hypothetical protein FGB62_3g351 [Gracilaria domingensis]